MVPVEVKEQCGEGHGDKGLDGRGVASLLPRRRPKVGLTKAKHGTKSGLRVERPKGREPHPLQSCKRWGDGETTGGQRGESASGLEAGERVVI